MTKDELKRRTRRFALDVIRLVDSLPRTRTTEVVGRQLLRSGSDVNKLRVERMLKIAIPVTCLIIALFGAPLATSTQRGGAAYGIAVSLGTPLFWYTFRFPLGTHAAGTLCVALILAALFLPQLESHAGMATVRCVQAFISPPTESPGWSLPAVASAVR